MEYQNSKALAQQLIWCETFSYGLWGYGSRWNLFSLWEKSMYTLPGVHSQTRCGTKFWWALLYVFTSQQIKQLKSRQLHHHFRLCEVPPFDCFEEAFFAFWFGVTLWMTLFGSSSFWWGSTSSYCIGLMITPGFLTIWKLREVQQWNKSIS